MVMAKGKFDDIMKKAAEEAKKKTEAELGKVSQKALRQDECDKPKTEKK
jgi:hypothetical protein